MKKPLSKSIATILAERVREKVYSSLKDNEKDIRTKVVASKEAKEYLKLMDKIKELEQKKEILKEAISLKYSTPVFRVSVYGRCTGEIDVSTSCKTQFRLDYIRDLLLLEDHFKENVMSTEQIVDTIVKKLIQK